MAGLARIICEAHLCTSNEGGICYLSKMPTLVIPDTLIIESSNGETLEVPNSEELLSCKDYSARVTHSKRGSNG